PFGSTFAEVEAIQSAQIAHPPCGAPDESVERIEASPGNRRAAHHLAGIVDSEGVAVVPAQRAETAKPGFAGPDKGAHARVDGIARPVVRVRPTHDLPAIVD